MSIHEHYMQRCFELARSGAGFVAPNPLVGSVLVHQGQIIGEGAHLMYGGPHAEVNAIKNCRQPELLSQCTLYVNLEPCSHHGKTPPCAHLIAQKQIPRVVVGSLDSNPLVSGRGIQYLRDAGAEVISGVLEAEARELNRRFYTWHEKRRPYIILKWAQTADGFIDRRRTPEEPRAIISSPDSHRLLHGWRAEEAAILVGTHTALFDDPHLTVRLSTGHHPVRLVIDRHNRLPNALRVFDGAAPTIVFSYHPQERPYADTVLLEPDNNELGQILQVLFERNLQSVLVEGGSALLHSFLKAGLWDEIRIFTSPQEFGTGVLAPALSLAPLSQSQSGPDTLTLYRNT
jgi:diaminohydroxyphosphoribosylaminopyrimidine deaminase / 5-amino-6-(5-phosphoribosylamino)uracil reductase